MSINHATHWQDTVHAYQVDKAKIGTPATANGAVSADNTPVRLCSIGPWTLMHFHFASAPGGASGPISPAIEISSGVRVIDKKLVVLGPLRACRSSADNVSVLITKKGSGRSVSARAVDADGGGIVTDRGLVALPLSLTVSVSRIYLGF
jgi:hypothetical protein